MVAKKPDVRSIYDIMDLGDMKFPDSTFKTLNQINVSKITESKVIGGRPLTYISWADAWTWLKLMYPDASMKVYETSDGSPLFTLNKSGYVKVGVTVNGSEHIERLAVMQSNRSMPLDAIQATDVINTIQRCATKAIARHGLGMHVYRGEDIPDDDNEAKAKAQPAAKPAPIVKTATANVTPKFVPATEIAPTAEPTGPTLAQRRTTITAQIEADDTGRKEDIAREIIALMGERAFATAKEETLIAIEEAFNAPLKNGNGKANDVKVPANKDDIRLEIINIKSKSLTNKTMVDDFVSKMKKNTVTELTDAEIRDLYILLKTQGVEV